MELSKEFVEQLSTIFFPEESFDDLLQNESLQISLEKNNKMVP